MYFFLKIWCRQAHSFHSKTYDHNWFSAFSKKISTLLIWCDKKIVNVILKKHIIKDYIYTNSILNSMGSTGDISQLNSISNAPVGVRIKFLNIFAVMM